MKTIQILKHQFVVDSMQSGFFCGESYGEAFGSVETSDLLFIGQTYCEALEWAWLKWHLDHDFKTIQSNLVAVADRVIKVMGNKKFPVGEDDDRGYHDLRLMYCAILSGDHEAMSRAAKQIKLARSGLKKYQHDAAVAGILASRILGQRKNEEIQFELEQERKASSADPFPSKRLLHAFIAKHYDQLQEEVEKVVQSHWSEKALPRTKRTSATEPVLSETESSIVINIMQKPSHFRWPYVEATFAKLAVMDGAAMTIDDFWFPLAFIEKF